MELHSLELDVVFKVKVQNSQSVRNSTVATDFIFSFLVTLQSISSRFFVLDCGLSSYVAQESCAYWGRDGHGFGAMKPDPAMSQPGVFERAHS